MNQHQQNPRSAADKAFIESLNQLQTTLQPVDKQAVQSIAPYAGSPDGAASDPFDLNSFEQAVADIEAFIQARQGQEEES